MVFLLIKFIGMYF